MTYIRRFGGVGCCLSPEETDFLFSARSGLSESPHVTLAAHAPFEWS